MAGERGEWDVDFSRFFNYPQLSASASASGILNPLAIAKMRSKGTWISAASSAVLRLARSRSATASVLSVRVSGFLAEEHFISNLCVSWPQVSCVPQCPIRGSRAVFLSYRNSSGQIHKFAVRFPSSCVAETFVNYVKECLGHTMDIQPPECDIVLCENSGPSEFVASNGPQIRFHEEPRFEKPVASRSLDMPALTYIPDQPDSPLQPLLANNIETIFSGLPPSFTELLNSCSADTEKASRLESNSTSQNKGYMQNPGLRSEDPSVYDASELPISTEIDFRAQIAKYMSDSSFQDMLFKIENVIVELGVRGVGWMVERLQNCLRLLKEVWTGLRRSGPSTVHEVMRIAVLTVLKEVQTASTISLFIETEGFQSELSAAINTESGRELGIFLDFCDFTYMYPLVIENHMPL